MRTSKLNQEKIHSLGGITNQELQHWFSQRTSNLKQVRNVKHLQNSKQYHAVQQRLAVKLPQWVFDGCLPYTACSHCLREKVCHKIPNISLGLLFVRKTLRTYLREGLLCLFVCLSFLEAVRGGGHFGENFVFQNYLRLTINSA